MEPVSEAISPLIETDDLFATKDKDAETHGDQPWAAPYEQTRAYRMLTEELLRESRKTDHEAIVLFVDDVQWADPATLDFLFYLARRIKDERLLLLFAYRREDVSFLSDWLHCLAEGRTIPP